MFLKLKNLYIYYFLFFTLGLDYFFNFSVAKEKVAICVLTPDNNSTNSNHGGPNDMKKHVGDFGNLLSNKNMNRIFYTKYYCGVSLYGKNSIINKSCVLHSGVDDLGHGKNAESLKNGNAGKRIACEILYEVKKPIKDKKITMICKKKNLILLRNLINFIISSFNYKRKSNF